MSTIKILDQSANSILYELPHGKPHPYQQCLVGEDRRDRVKQKAQTEGACQYYVCNYLRLRIGKSLCEALIQERNIEKICSSRKKAVSMNDRLITKVMEQILNIQTLKENTTRAEKQEELQLLEECSHGHTNSVEDSITLLQEKKFAKLIEINTRFFEELGIAIKEVFTFEMTPENGYLDAKWSDFEQLSIRKKGALLDLFAIKVMAEKYGLKESSWKPSDKIESLIEELNKNGPLAIAGFLGRIAYSDEPVKLNQQLGGRDIYGWIPGAKRNPVEDLTVHMCLIVGAKKIGGLENILFIDPYDPSDPNDKSAQKIYFWPYKTFTENAIDFHGRPYSNELLAGKVPQAP